jgi:hypothetical protein
MLTRAREPFQRPQPMPDTGFYPDEQDEFDAILAKPYAEIDESDWLFLVGEGLYFIPPLYLRYFAPALAELAVTAAIDDDFRVEQLGRVLSEAAPLPNPARIAADLRVALMSDRCAVRSDYMTIPEPLLSPFPAGHAYARLFQLVLEVDGDSEGNRAFLDSDAANAHLVIVEHARGILEGGWIVPGPAAVWFMPDALVTRLERIKESRSAMAALAARFVLGEVDAQDLPVCGNPDCAPHQRGRRPPRP